MGPQSRGGEADRRDRQERKLVRAPWLQPRNDSGDGGNSEQDVEALGVESQVEEKSVERNGTLERKVLAREG